MNGLDFFFSPSATVEDDEWGEFVDSKPNPNGFSADPKSTPDRIESEKKGQTPWKTCRSPVPLSVFGEEEEEDASLNLSIDSFPSGKRNDGAGSGSRVVNTNPTNGHRNKAQNQSQALTVDLPRSLSSQKVENSAVRLDDSDLAFVDNTDGWEFQKADGVPKEEQEYAKTGSLMVQNATTLSSSIWTSPTNPSFDRDNGDDDSWVNGEWEFKVADTGEPQNNSTNKESNGWGFGSDVEPVLEIETTSSFQSNFKKEMQNRDGGSFSFPSNANVNSGGTSWAFKQPSSETGNEKEEKKEQTEKPKGVLPLSFFEDEKTSDTFVHEDNLVSLGDFSVRDKTKAPSPTVSINDLISSLYSQVQGKHAVNLSENSDGFGFVSVKAATDSNLFNGEGDSWDYQGPTKTITDSSIAEGAADDFDSNEVFQDPSLTFKNTDVAECIDEFDDDSWEFQGPTQPVRNFTSRKGDNGSWESKHSSMDNEGCNRFYVTDGFGDLPEKPVTSIEPNDFKDFFSKLKTELYYIALNHLEALKEARDLAAGCDDDAEVRKCDGDIKDLQNWLSNDALINKVDVESVKPRSSGISQLSKALQEPKFRVLDAEDLLSERLLLAEKDWKSTIELLKHATLTLKILNLGSREQQSKYASIWFVIASTCAQELQHAASIWKRVIENNVQEQILSTPQGKSCALSVREIYRVVKILRASTRLYRPWILLAPISYNVLAVLDECIKLWMSSGLEEALRNNFNHQGLDGDYSADQLLVSVEVDAFMLQTSITSATSPTCYISGLSAEIVPGIKMVEWDGKHYLVPLANLWANLISREPPSLPGHCFPTLS